MPRTRAGDAATRAFGRVGNIPADNDASDVAGITASENDSGAAIPSASAGVSDDASKQAGRKTGKNAGERRRRVGRPRGPDRVPLTVRILATTDERLTAAVEATGESPQQIADAAFSEYLTRIGY